MKFVLLCLAVVGLLLFHCGAGLLLVRVGCTRRRRHRYRSPH